MELTPQQREAIETRERRVCVDAGAGSGKTRVLVEHVIHLLERRDATLDRIAAITFTDKAASEMKQRLRAACRERASHLDAQTMTFWRDIERRVETARISTIHGFCSGFLRENALALDADPDFAILADAESVLLRNEVVETALHGLLEHGEAAAIRLATEFGPGVLLRMLSAMLTQRPALEQVWPRDPHEDPAILAQTWRTLVDGFNQCRFAQLRQSPELRVMLKRLDGLAGHCTDAADKREALRSAMVTAVTRILEGPPAEVAEHVAVLRKLHAIGGSKKCWTSPDAFDEVKAIRDEMIRILDAFSPIQVQPEVDEPAARLTCDLYAVYQEVHSAFQEAKAARSVKDFDDLILDTLRMLRERSDVRERTARSIRHLLIDEFQDTDYRQLEIARLLADTEGGPSLFIVGDAKQSIYRFRGAEVEVFARARKDARKVIPLAENFRSRPDVLEFINHFFSTTGLLEAVESPYRGLGAQREAIGRSRVEFLLPEANEQASVEERRAAEAELIAWRIADLCGADPPEARFGDVALLFRASSDMYIYERSLRERDIPYTVVAGAGFFDRQEVADVLNLLTVVIEPWNEVALLGFLRSPMVGLSDDALARMCRRNRLARAFNANGVEDGPQSDRLRRARELVVDLRRRREMPLPGFLRHVLERTGYEAILLSQFLGVQKAGNVRKVLDLAEQFTRAGTGTLAAFIRYLGEVAAEEIREGEADIHPEGSDSVTLMTIHKAKGLEFPVVIVPDLARGATHRQDLPLSIDRSVGLAVRITDAEGESQEPSAFRLVKAMTAQREEAERARILYVAMTRSRERLILSGAREKDTDGAGKTWLDILSRTYCLNERKDGETFSGPGWQALVRRKPGAFPATTLEQPKDSTPNKDELERRAAPLTGPLRSTARTIAVTELLPLMAGEESPVLAESVPETPSDGDPRLRGTLAHALFEEWDFRAPVGPVLDAVLSRECPDRALGERLREGLRVTAERFQSSDLGKRLANDPGIRREVPFLLEIDGVLLSGAIDALLEDGAIVDYKTGQLHPQLHARYEMQLRLYAAAVNRLSGRNCPGAVLCYIDTNEQHPVDVSHPMIDETLARARKALSTRVVP